METSYTTVGGYVIWKTAWTFLEKLKLKLSYAPAFPLLGIYLEKTKTLILRYMHYNVHSSTVYKSKCPQTEEQIKKMQYIQM